MTGSDVAPGLRHWTARHPNIGWLVSSYALVAEGVLLNPLLPDPDEGELDGITVRAIVLTNRHHVRSAQDLAADGVTIHAPAAGLHDLQDVRPPVEGYEDGDALPGGLVAVEVGALSPDEFAVFSAEHRALAVADGVMRDGDGPLQAVPDGLMGDDPAGVRRGLAEAYTRICDELEFDHLLLAHGPPVIGDGREQLRRYAASL
jgi:hypothetical protein